MSHYRIIPDRAEPGKPYRVSRRLSGLRRALRVLPQRASCHRRLRLRELYLRLQGMRSVVVGYRRSVRRRLADHRNGRLKLKRLRRSRSGKKHALGLDPRDHAQQNLGRQFPLLPRKPPAIVRRREIQFRAERHDARRIDRRHAHVIVPLDVIHVHGLGDAGTDRGRADSWTVRIIDDAAQIAFEVAVVDRVEANERREQPPIRFGQPRADQIALARQNALRSSRAPRTPCGSLLRTRSAWSRSRRDRRRYSRRYRRAG